MIRRSLGLLSAGVGAAAVAFSGPFASLSGVWVDLLAVATVVIGLVVFLDAGTSEADDRWSPSVPDPPRRVPVPGDNLAAMRDREIRARMRDRAVETVMRVEGCAHSTAVERVDDGDWTDDRLAAAYLGDRPLPRTARLAGITRLESVTERARRRTVRAIRRLREGEQS